MVFESVIANLLNAYLGHFIDDVNASQLQLGAWRGNVELKNLAIKEDAFASLDLPFKILHGHIGKLTTIIPWSSLYSSPVQLSLQDVFVVAVPNVLEEYDDDIEAERAWQAKKKQLNLIETTRKNLDLQDQKRKNFNKVAQEDDGFVTKLAAQVIRNVQIHISNIHIVYEDKFTDMLNPFQVGLTLNKIVFETVEDLASSQQHDKYSETQKQELIFKVTSIDYLSIYFNCERDIKFLSELKNATEIDTILSRRIASSTNHVSDKNLDYVLKPVTFRGNLVINSKPEKFDFSLPVADVDMILGDFIVNLKKSQLHSITSFMDSLNRIRVASAFRKFRPTVGVHKHSNEWWQFALSSILERDIKPRRNNWNWKRMKKHRQRCREYKELYKEKLLCQNATEKIAIEEELEDYEREMDVFNIILCRSHADIECAPELEKRRAEEAKKGGSWFSLSGWGLGGWTSSAKTEKETEEIVSNLQREMTQEEKEKLYNAIGYDSSSIGVLDTPKEFVGFLVNFRLDSIRCLVTGFDENFRIGEFCMRNINFAVQFRPAASAAQIAVTFDSTSILTSSEDPNQAGKSASIDSRRKALAFARSASKTTDESKADFGLHLESKSFNLECSYEPKPEGVSINMNSAVEEIQLTLTSFTSYSYKLPVETKYCILSPCTIRMISQTEANNQVMHVEFSKLDVHMAPQAYKIINNVTNAFRGNTEVKIVEKPPPKSSDILLPKILSRDSRYRSKDVVESALEVTEDMNTALQAAAKTIAASSPFDTTGNAQREVYLDMRNINFVVESGIVNPQPLIKFHSSIFGQLQNSNFIKLECQCLLNYHNEKKSAWEPMIEPVSYDPYPSGEPVLWKFDVIIDMKEVNGQSVMNIELESQEQLDLTITKTAINVLLSLLDTLSEDNDRADVPKLPAPIRDKSKSDVHVFKNLLPFCIKFNIIGKDDVHELEAGEECPMDSIKFGKTEMRIKLLDYLGYSWVADNTISSVTEDEEFDTWKFFPSGATHRGQVAHSLDPIPYNPGHRRTDSSDEYTLTVLLATTKDSSGLITSTLFSPYWLINKTGQLVNWKSSGRRGYNVIDPGTISYPILMSFRQTLFSKKRMQMKVNDSDFSESFPVDVVGSNGTVLVKGKNGAFYTITVQITMSRIGLTKIITANPFYLIINKTKHTIEYSEDNYEFKQAPGKSTTPLWPYRLKDLTLCFRFADQPDISSKLVSLTSSNACLLSIYDRLVYVTVEVEESGVQITLEDYFDGCSPILFVNGTERSVISYGQTGCKQRFHLPPMHSAHFTWHNPMGERTVKWCMNDGPEIPLNPRQDQISMSDDKETCWVSFVDGSQRVLFVTNNFTLATEMMHAIEFVQPQMEITMQSRGFGLSLVDDVAGLEIAYLGIAPSDLIWEIKQPDRRHYQPLPLKDIEILEAAFKKQYAKLQSRTLAGFPNATDSKTKTITKLSRKLKVEWPNELNSLEYPVLLEPIVGQLRRVKNRGIWGYIGYSEHTTQLHFKLSHMQIDNQMSDCLFSTIMSHIAAPRSVVGDQVPKPFFEFSAIIQRQANLRRFKYLSLLVQEFFIKIEYSFIQHLMEFSDEASTWYYRNYTHKEMIETDLDLILNSDKVLVESITRSNRILYDLIHFSPLKLNVSFSFSSHSDDKDEGVSLPLGLDFIIRSAGVTLTEFQDVTFKLDCFERNMVLFTQEQLLWASLDHYKRQILKQFYVVVLGLDVIGNPVSLVMDLRQGVGDFFYEPFQGIIKGPEEAVEGLALGVASLFSHTVGGAIGALSKISGTLGEGISSLTFDDELKKRRRQRRREQPNIARSGKDLVEGFVGGITGIVTRPISGAKEDGFEGFMKGVGKGMIGVVTQPATSIVDFATGTLNAIKDCVNEQKGPKRLRPPRVIIVGQPLSPYNRYEAEKLLLPTKKR
jgi:hypothetical protein